MKGPSNGKKEKRQAYTFKSGAVYDGEWIGNMRDGTGVQKWPDGARYEGERKNNKAHGKGKFFHVDGDVFEGMESPLQYFYKIFKNILYFLKGQWIDDKANGFGIYLHVNGAKYEGDWKDDLQHGFGIETWADGSRYEGNYQLGKKQGKGFNIYKKKFYQYILGINKYRNLYLER